MKRRYQFKKLRALPQNLDNPSLLKIAEKYGEEFEIVAVYDIGNLGALPTNIATATGKTTYDQLTIPQWQIFWALEQAAGFTPHRITKKEAI